MKKFTTHTREAIVAFSGSRKEVCNVHRISRTWDYKLRKRYRNGESLDTRSSRPHHIRVKARPVELTDELLESCYEKYLNPGYQRFYLQLKHDNPDMCFSERDIKKIYEEKGWMRRKKKEEKIRYEKEKPGELGHTDLKYMPKIGTSRDYFQELLDDSTRLAAAAILPDKTANSAREGLSNSYDRLAIEIKKLLSDNGAEVSYNNLPIHKRPKDKLHPVAEFCKEKGITQKYTRPCRPETNGKSERLHRTLNDEVLSKTHFSSSEEMIEAIDKWLKWYNEERVHMGIRMTPLEKMKQFNPDYIPPRSYLTVISKRE